MFLIPTILLIFLLVCVLILLVPFHISLKINKMGGLITGIFELHWSKLRVFKKEFPEEEEEKLKKEEKKLKKKEKKEKEKVEKKVEKKWNWEEIKKIIKLVWASLEHISRFLEDILKSIQLEKLRMHVILGFNSPVDTATTVGYIWAAVSLINFLPKIYISAEPSFNEEMIDGEFSVDLKIRMIRPFIAVLRLLSKKPVLKLLWEIRRLRNEG